MDNTSIRAASAQTGIRPATASLTAPAADAKRPRPGLPKQTLSALASLRLTVVLFALSLVLVFAGTLAQIDNGIQTVMAKYFRSFFVWIPLQLFFPRSLHVSGGFPFLGGWSIGFALLFNLLAAH